MFYYKVAERSQTLKIINMLTPKVPARRMKKKTDNGLSTQNRQSTAQLIAQHPMDIASH